MAFCWGSNQFGYNGNGTLLGSHVPERVHGGIAFNSISTGVLGLHTCGLTGAGKVYCWGYNSAGELGDGTRTQRLEPVAVVGAGAERRGTQGCSPWVQDIAHHVTYLSERRHSPTGRRPPFWTV